MKRIAIITNNIRWVYLGAQAGGGSVVARNLISELINMNQFEIDVYSLYTNRFINGANVIKIDAKTFKEYEKEVYKKIKEGNYDIVLNVSGSFFNENAFLQTQTYRHRANSEPFPINIIKRFIGMGKINRQDRQFSNLKPTNKYFAVSKFVKDDYIKNYKLPEKSVYVCSLGCNKVYEQYPEKRKKGRITFGIVANSSMNKGGYYAIIAFGLLKHIKKLKNFHINLILPKYKKDTLMKFLLSFFKLGKHVSIWGQQEDMHKFYCLTDCLIVPSKYEAFGLVVTEALSYGLPVIVSSSVGATDILTQGKEGFIFNRKSIFDLVNYIRRMMYYYNKDFKKYQELSKNAYETSTKHTWRDFVNDVLAKFDK